MGDRPRRTRSYSFYGQTTSLCSECLELVPAKVAIADGKVFYLKRCPTHGDQRSLISTDPDYFKLCRDYLKPGDLPLRFQTQTEFGCPYDCGLCPDHEQHSCLALIDVNEACNLTCPVCFADSSPGRTLHRPLEEIERMLDALVVSEGEPDLLQLSGGEPTIHPQFLEILAAAKRRPIRHVMINTNGLRLAQEPDFVRALADHRPGIEIYLQFDSLRAESLEHLRGADLSRVRRQALEHLERESIPTTLVVVVKRGVNDDQFDEILDFALQWKCVRGVSFQPIQDAGRNEGFRPAEDRVVLSEIRQRIVEGGSAFDGAEIIPLPCNPESIAVGYALRDGRRIMPITSWFPREMLIDELPNTISFEKHTELRRRAMEFFSLSTAEVNHSERLASLLCCLPDLKVPERLGYEDIFRIAIVEFLDAHNFCLGRVKRSCVHFVTPQGRIVPFDTYNLFYRDGRIDGIRESLRSRASRANVEGAEWASS